VHTMTDPGGGIVAAEHLFAEQPLTACGRSSTCRATAGKTRGR
jgi:hypothetical protein